MMSAKTREEWLTEGMRELNARAFKRYARPVPEDVKVACGWTMRDRARGGRAGICHPRSHSAAQVPEIFVSPKVSDPFGALEILAHELIHAVLDCAGGHGKPFRDIALQIGLTGPMKSTRAGPALSTIIQTIVAQLGPYPHASLSLPGKEQAQSTRMLKCWCPRCGYVARVAGKWLAEAGSPICPTHRMPMCHGSGQFDRGMTKDELFAALGLPTAG